MDAKQREEMFLDLFLHPGWKQLMVEMEEAHDILIASAINVAGERELYRLKGQVQKLRDMLHFEQLIRLEADEKERDAAE